VLPNQLPRPEQEDLFICENIKAHDPSRQAPPERIFQEIEELLSAHPGAFLSRYDNQDHQDFAYSLSLFWAGFPEAQVRIKLEETSVNARGRREYVDKTVSNARIAYGKAEKPKRDILKLAEEMAVAAVGAAWKGGADAIVPPQATPAKTRSLATQALKVLAAHLNIAALAERTGKKNYTAPTGVICKLAKVNGRNVAKINRILVDGGWLIQIKAPVYHPKYGDAGVYRLAGVPDKAQGYQSPTVNSRIEMLHLGILVLTEVVTKKGKDWNPQTQHPESIISRYLLPTHPCFDSCPEAWFLWRALLWKPGLNANRLSKILKVHRATAGRMLKKLEAAGLVGRLNKGWQAIAPGVDAASVEATHTVSEAAEVKENLSTTGDIPADSEPEPATREEMEAAVSEFANSFGKPSDDTAKYEQTPDSPSELLAGMVSPRTQTPVRFISQREKLDRQQHELRKQILLGDYVTDDEEEFAYAGTATG